MISVMVTYRVKPDAVEENTRLVEAVYEELAQVGDPDVHYATFTKGDGRTFVHVAFFPSPEKQAVLGGTAAFQEFQRNLADRCEEPPGVEPIDRVGSYNFSYPA